eukprot:c3524_g1_i2 orf=703-1971(+)
MDFEGQLSSMQPALCVDYAEIPVCSMMALITEQEHEGRNSLMANVMHGSFGYYNQHVDPYHHIPVVPATQALHADNAGANSCGLRYSVDRFQPESINYVNESIKSAKSGGIPSHMDVRNGQYAESPVLVSAKSVVSQDTRGLAPALDIESTCANELSEEESIRSKILSHPHYARLVSAYVNCQKVGAPADVVAKLDAVSREYQHLQNLTTSATGEDAELDEFMDTYCNMLTKYHEELARPFQEAMTFCRKIELQLNSLNQGSYKFSPSGEYDEKKDMNGSSEEDVSCGEIEFHDVDPLAEDNKLKEQLLRKYSGYICTLKQEFLKKKKKGKLPKEARQKLLDWWSLHYKWPYPSEIEKTSLAESTGLDQKQINNWFINQRKRHWKLSEDLQYVMVDAPNCNTTVQVAQVSIKPEKGTILINQ